MGFAQWRERQDAATRQDRASCGLTSPTSDISLAYVSVLQKAEGPSVFQTSEDGHSEINAPGRPLANKAREVIYLYTSPKSRR